VIYWHGDNGMDLQKTVCNISKFINNSEAGATIIL